MNFGGGCCIVRYGGGGGGEGEGGAYDMSKVDRIMHRFRPIAPRPASGGSSSPPEKNGLVIVCPKSGRGRRRYAKGNNNSRGSVSSNGSNKRCNKRRRDETKERSGGGGAVEVVTLPLLPETPERKDSPARVFTSQFEGKPIDRRSPPFWLSFGNGKSDVRYQRAASSDLTEVMPAITETVVSCVTVECIIDTWMEGYEYGIGNTDEEKKMNLEKDTCPGFISDGEGKVTWTNRAYRELVGRGRLVMRERAMLTYTAFTCRVRMEYKCRSRERSSITLPCDVWRMNDGGFAWRLDLNAALCLGR